MGQGEEIWKQHRASRGAVEDENQAEGGWTQFTRMRQGTNGICTNVLDSEEALPRGHRYAIHTIVFVVTTMSAQYVPSPKKHKEEGKHPFRVGAGNGNRIWIPPHIVPPSVPVKKISSTPEKIITRPKKTFPREGASHTKKKSISLERRGHGQLNK